MIKMLLGVKYFGPDTTVLKLALAPEIPGSSSTDSNLPTKFRFG